MAAILADIGSWVGGLSLSEIWAALGWARLPVSLLLALLVVWLLGGLGWLLRWVVRSEDQKTLRLWLYPITPSRPSHHKNRNARAPRRC